MRVHGGARRRREVHGGARLRCGALRGAAHDQSRGTAGVATGRRCRGTGGDVVSAGTAADCGGRRAQSFRDRRAHCHRAGRTPAVEGCLCRRTRRG